MSVALVRYSGHVEHRAPGSHPERPERVLAIDEALAASGLQFDELEARPATDAELLTAHAPEVLKTIAELASSGGGWIDGDTYVRPDSELVARFAAGATVALVAHLVAGRARRGLALVRPPGHHATRQRSMGFCLYNNVAIAARVAGKRTLIVDWDVHHGNGTQDIFYEDASVAYASIHESPLYPGTGRADETGRGPGAGLTYNVPVPSGSGDETYVESIEAALGELYERLLPELIIVSAGFDAHARDPLASCTVTTRGFATMAERILARAGAVPVAFVLEGGYDTGALAESVVAVARTCFAG